MPALSSEKITSLISCYSLAGRHSEMKAVEQLKSRLPIKKRPRSMVGGLEMTTKEMSVFQIR
tara:strand:- start:92 stop:277 length:186 start_codon:yes stop_codon:yes gene_type:complete